MKSSGETNSVVQTEEGRRNNMGEVSEVGKTCQIPSKKLNAGFAYIPPDTGN